MRTTIDFLNAFKKKLGNVSDYKAAQALNVTRAMTSDWRTGKKYLSEKMAVRLAKLAKLDAGYVLACTAAERAQARKDSEVAAAWKRAARRLSN